MAYHFPGVVLYFIQALMVTPYRMSPMEAYMAQYLGNIVMRFTAVVPFAWGRQSGCKET